MYCVTCGLYSEISHTTIMDLPKNVEKITYAKWKEIFIGMSLFLVTFYEFSICHFIF